MVIFILTLTGEILQRVIFRESVDSRNLADFARIYFRKWLNMKDFARTYFREYRKSKKFAGFYFRELIEM